MCTFNQKLKASYVRWKRIHIDVSVYFSEKNPKGLTQMLNSFNDYQAGTKDWPKYRTIPDRYAELRWKQSLS